VRNRAIAVLLSAVFALGSSGCLFKKKKTDAELAAEERAAAEKRIQDSFVLVPYRALKALFRANGVNPPPPDLVELLAALNELQKFSVLKEPHNEAIAIGKLALALYRAREHMRKVDEDNFPTLWMATLKTPNPLPWYDAGAEHLFVGSFEVLSDIALRRDPVAELFFYEFTRAKPAPSWPPILRVCARGLRSFAYFIAHLHYAAEEEYTFHLAELAQLKPEAFVTQREIDEFVAGGHFLRALNRFALEREYPAYADLEAGLAKLKELGIDNELTDWGWAMIYARGKRFDDAKRHLEKLAASPNLDDAERAEIRACAATLGKWDKGFVPFGKTRAQLVILRAMIARAGGLEKMLVSWLGPELGHKIYEPLAFFDHVREKVSAASHDTVDATKDASKRGLDIVRGKLDTLRRKTANANPTTDGGS
jgi:hypothetical protein